MKNALLIALITIFFATSCVQKTNTKTVVYILTLPKLENVQSVGIRGNDKPLNWDNDFELKAIKPDNLYEAIVTYKTGYKFTEVKFVVDDKFEFQNSPNRRIEFSPLDTTYYAAEYNVQK